MSIDLLERAAVALGDLTDEVVFVGGATVTLWITDPAAPPPRPTKDVDVIVEVATRAGYYAFEDRLRAIGFRNDEHVICRWHHPVPQLMLDAMPRCTPPCSASTVPPGNEARGVFGQGRR